MISVELEGVRLELPANTPVVILRESEGRRRLLPIYIGSPEAAAIAYALEGLQPPRPLTHDLLRTVLEELGASLQMVVVNDIQEHTFFAELHLDVAGAPHTISSRPSDAIALAIRTRSPIFVEDSVFDAAGQDPPPPGDDEPEEILEEFRAFIEDVNPEDFGA